MVLTTTGLSAQIDSTKALYKGFNDSKLKIASGNSTDVFSGLSQEDISMLSDGSMDITKTTSFMRRAEIVAKDFESAGTQLNNLQDIVAEMEAALSMDNSNSVKTQTLTHVSDKLLSNLAILLQASGQNGKKLFSGSVDSNNIRTSAANYDNANNITSAGYMTQASSNDNISLSEGDNTNIAIRPEDLKDIIGAAQEIKRLAAADQNVPDAVSAVFKNGGTALSSMISNVKSVFDKASQSVEDHKSNIGSIRDNLRHHMGVNESIEAQKLSDLASSKQMLDSIEALQRNIEQFLMKILVNS